MDSRNLAIAYAVDNYGPIWIPKKGESIALTLKNLPDIFVVNADGSNETKRKFCEERGIEDVGGSLWRTSYDVRDMWKDIVHQGGMGILDIVNVTAPLAKDVRHGQWPDMDMLVVGLNGKGGPSSDLGGKI